MIANANAKCTFPEPYLPLGRYYTPGIIKIVPRNYTPGKGKLCHIMPISLVFIYRPLVFLLICYRLLPVAMSLMPVPLLVTRPLSWPAS